MLLLVLVGLYSYGGVVGVHFNSFVVGVGVAVAVVGIAVVSVAVVAVGVVAVGVGGVVVDITAIWSLL